MEEQVGHKISEFLAVSNGDGYGSGSGFGFGDGAGYGYGDGDGDGSGYGYGDGDGAGSGYGDGSGNGSGYGYGDGDGDGDGAGYGSGDGDIPEFNLRKVYIIDNIPTLIDSLHGNYAMGHILNSDFTLTPCYISKVEDCFAHGETLAEATKCARSKAMERMPLEQRISKFIVQFPDPDKLAQARELYDWHHVLTGSCKMGRDMFAKEKGIDIERDSLTVREFIILTKNAYGQEAIRKLAEAYGIIV